MYGSLWHEKNENTQYKERIHERVDSSLNEQYHFMYRGLYREALTYPWFNSSIKLFFEMSGTKATPLLGTHAQNGQDAQNIINYQFVRSSLPGGSQNSNANLVNSLREALTEAEMERGDIDETLKNFDPNYTISEYFAVQNNLNIVKCKGKFEFFQCFNTF